MDEPFLDLGKSLQFQQKDMDSSSEAWEMHEFLSPRLERRGEEREMLVDEEYEIYQDHLRDMEAHPPPPHIREPTSASPRLDLQAGPQWLHADLSGGEILECHDTESMMTAYPQEMQDYSFSTTDMVRLCYTATSSSPCPSAPCSYHSHR